MTVWVMEKFKREKEKSKNLEKFNGRPMASLQTNNYYKLSVLFNELSISIFPNYY